MKLPAPEYFYDLQQGSDEWLLVRLGIPTASEFSSIMAKGQGKTRATYMRKLIGEVLTDKPSTYFESTHTERGHEMEPEARSLYELLHDVDATRVGFVRAGCVGASPDSLIGDDGLLEIKTRLPHLQIEVLQSGKVPSENVAQLQGQLWVADRQWVDYMSYWPALKPFIRRVERDAAYIDRLENEVGAFIDEMHAVLKEVRA